MSVPASAQKVVNFWHTEPNPKSKAAIDEIIKDFEKANPGIKVDTGGDRLGRSRQEDAGGAGLGRIPRDRAWSNLRRALLVGQRAPAAAQRRDRVDRRERHLRCGEEARLQHQGQEVLRHRPRGRHRPHRLPQGLHARGGPRSREGAEDLRRVEGDAHQADRQGQGPLWLEPRRPRLLHQRGPLHVGRLERRTTIRRERPPDVHREAGARGAGVLEGAQRLLPRARLALARLSGHVR